MAKAPSKTPRNPVPGAQTAASIVASAEAEALAVHADIVAASQKLKEGLAAMPQPQLLALIGNHLVKPELHALAMLLSACAQHVEDPIIRTNLNSLVDLHRMTPALIAMKATAVAPPAARSDASA